MEEFLSCSGLFDSAEVWRCVDGCGLNGKTRKEVEKIFQRARELSAMLSEYQSR